MNKELFPPVDGGRTPTARLFALQIRWVLADYGPEHYRFHYRPNYISGAPQRLASPEALGQLAEAEYLVYQQAESGAYGYAAAEDAHKFGVAQICFVTWKDGEHVMVYDVLTRRLCYAHGYISNLHHLK